LQAWVVSDCKKLKCVIAKTAGFISVTAKKKKKEKLSQCVIATIWRE
jgi:hypothetical protein